ncbi:MAG TPA: PLP-dependent aminotransferase family protein [Solirubrobacteraceae bacterium]|jgi:2-aminoadipate transaminase|nr:PLP-dependent aminotransferase family protein [Solirubrobacteraceae bacterium]
MTITDGSDRGADQRAADTDPTQPAQAPVRPRRPASREIERYTSLFAARTRMMRSSAMRDLMAITEHPEVISLAGGLPDTSTFPPELFREVMGQVAERATARALQYGPTEGLAGAKDCVIEVMAAEGMAVSRDEILITTGGQQVIDLVCKALIDPGDVIIAEAPTYPGAVPTFCSYEAEVIQIEIDGDGMRVDRLEETLATLAAAGRRPKFIYTIPTFQNPGGVTMSLARRRQLVEVARVQELLVLEDNPYGLLRYEGEPLPTLRFIDGGDLVIYLGTFSKILSPGLRLGWAVAPRPVLAKMNLGKQAADLCSSSTTQHFVAAYFQTGGWLEYIAGLRELYRRRRDVMLDALSEHFPAQARWTHPHGGLFIWVTLPDYIDTTDLLARALDEKVAFVPGAAAYIDGRGGSSMRLNFSGVSEELIREGVRRIGKTIAAQVALYGAVSGTTAPAGGIPARASVVLPPELQPAPEPREPDTGLADVFELPRRPRGDGEARPGQKRRC